MHSAPTSTPPMGRPVLQRFHQGQTVNPGILRPDSSGGPSRGTSPIVPSEPWPERFNTSMLRSRCSKAMPGLRHRAFAAKSRRSARSAALTISLSITKTSGGASGRPARPRRVFWVSSSACNASLMTSPVVSPTWAGYAPCLAILRTLHVGFLNDCFFEPATALCLDRNRSTDRSVPVLAHCSPDRCPNSCITRRHLAPWKASIAEADALLAKPGLPPLQRAALIADNARKRQVVAPLIEGTP